MSDSVDRPNAKWQGVCPVPIAVDADRITLVHGEGGRSMRRLIEETILPLVAPTASSPRSLNDAARLPAISGPVAMTSDSFVVSPLFFPGGDIGSLAVFGTVNDLAVSGARPLALTLSLIIEEGLPIPLLEQILGSAARAARRSGVTIVAGDTKVVPRGAADGLYINTTGLGEFPEQSHFGTEQLSPGDQLLVSGPIGCHGMAVLCAREELHFDPPPQSDSAPLHDITAALQSRLGGQLRAMRDATRGGVTAVLHEWAEAAGVTINVIEGEIPQTPAVRGTAELLGLDPLHVANEGTMVVAVASAAVETALQVMQQFPQTASAARIGQIQDRHLAPVTIRRALGGDQPLDEPPGILLPRIC